MSLFKTQKVTTKAEKLNFQSTTCNFGTPLPIAYGLCRVSPNLINWQDMKTVESRSTTGSGKAKQTSIDYKYYVYLEMALTESPIDSVKRIWVNDDKYNSLADLGSKEGGALSANLGNNPNPTTYMSTHHPDIAVGYKNMAYLYGESVYLGTNNASVPSYIVEIETPLRTTGDGTDCNPADVVLDLLVKSGAVEKNGNTYTHVDATSLDNYRTYCREADLLISSPMDAFSSQKKAQEYINEILTLTNTYIIWSIDRFKFIVRDDRKTGAWNPNKTVMYDLTEDDFIKQSDGACVIYNIKTASEIYNRFGITYTDRSNDYEETTVFYDNTESIAEIGINANSVIDGRWFHTKTRAIKCAELLARVNNTETVRYTVKLDWAFERLEVGDIITLTDSAIGLNKQVCMIDEITTDTYGKPTITAIKRPDGDYSTAQYDVHQQDYNYVDQNVTPSNSATPLFIIPPSDLVSSSANGLEIWIAVNGAGVNWGGCDVYISDKDSEYRYAGTQGTSSVYGKIKSSLTANGTSVDVEFISPKDVDILTGSAFDAENGNTLIWINGECMSYASREMLQDGDNRYRLSGLVRGQFGTKAVAHSINESIVVLDDRIYRVPLTKHYQGRTMYFKFPAYNQYKGNVQDISTLDEYTCVANIADIPNVSDVIAYNKYREMADDVTRYDVIVEWQPPDFASYKQAQVWYKTSNAQGNSIGVISEGVSGDNLGFTGKWVYGGQGYNSVTIPQAVIGDTYKIAVCTEDIYGNAESPDMSEQIEILIARKTETPNTPSGLSVKATDKMVISWNEVRNADIKWYEIRTNANVGEDNGLVGRTTETEFSTNAVTERAGKIYVFAVGASGENSAPAQINYYFPTPTAPSYTAKAGIRNITLVASTIPANCYAIKYTIVGASYAYSVITKDLAYIITAEPDVYDITACFVDIFGDGSTADAQCTVELLIDSSWVHISENTIFDNNVIVSRMLKAGAVTADKMSVNSLSAITGTIGTLRTKTTGARVEISDNLIKVYDSNNVLRVKMGVF